jgi:hypothetical protein
MTVDVRIPLESASGLRPGTLSIVDGQTAERTVTVRCLLDTRGTRVALPLDEATAVRLELADRRARIGRWSGAVLVVLTVVNLAVQVAVHPRLDYPASIAVGSLTLPLAVGAFLLARMLGRGDDPRHPVREGRSVVVRQVDANAAAEWHRRNPGVGMELVASQ